jgi:thioredoxin-like negative regulator of GroEL
MRQLRAAFTIVLLSLSQTLLTAQAVPPVDPAFKAQFEEGQQAFKAGKYKDAINALKKANKLQHNSCGECYLLMAVAYYRSGELTQCEENCDKTVATATDDGTRAIAHNLKGTAVLTATDKRDSKKAQESESEFRSAIQLDPKSAVFHLNLARALLRESKDDEAKQELQACLALRPEEKQASEARLLLSDSRRGREEFAPEFEVSTLQGQTISLKQLVGRVVVMDFWATWCPPCRESVPELKELTRKYPTEKLTLISVSADKDERAWKEFVARKNMDWAQYRDADHKILDTFGIHSFPTYLVIDGDGIIKERLTGLNPQQSVVARLRSTLGQMPQLEGEARK